MLALSTHSISSYVHYVAVVAPCAEISVLDEMHRERVWGNLSLSEKRPYLLYFGGSIRQTELQYSGGARQAFHTYIYLRNHSRVKLGGGGKEYT